MSLALEPITPSTARDRFSKELDAKAVEGLMWTAAWILERSRLSPELHAHIEHAWAMAGHLRRELEEAAQC